MNALAHSVQFLSLGLGFVALYISFFLKKKIKNDSLKSYLIVLAGINFIILIHVFETFFKITLPKKTYDENLRIVFLLLIIPLTAVRLFISVKFLLFCQQIRKRKLHILYNYSALAIFLWFTVSFLAVIFQNIAVLSIHIMLSVSLISGSVIVLRKKKEAVLINQKIITPFFLLLILYTVINLSLRILNSFQYTITEHSQMFWLGVAAIIFNLSNIIYLKNLFYFNSSHKNYIDDISSITDFNFTIREEEIINLLCEGKTNKEIAEVLFISPYTVRDHLANIYKKTNVKNRTQLTRTIDLLNKKSALK